MDAMLAKFESLYSSGVGVAVGMAISTFSLVAAIDFIWKVLKTLLSEENQIVLLIRCCVKYGMIAALITNYESWSNLFLDSLMTAGAAIGGGGVSGGDLKLPGTVFEKGLQNLKPILDMMVQNLGSIYSIPMALINIITYVLGMICYGVIAAQIFITWVEWYVIGACAVIFIAFLPNDSTKFMGEKAIGAVVATGVKLMVMGVVLSGVLEAINTLPLATDPTNSQCWINIGTMGILAWLSWQAPGMAAGLLAGSPSLSADNAKGPGAAAANAFGGGHPGSGGRIPGPAKGEIPQTYKAATNITSSSKK